MRKGRPVNFPWGNFPVRKGLCGLSYFCVNFPLGGWMRGTPQAHACPACAPKATPICLRISPRKSFVFAPNLPTNHTRRRPCLDIDPMHFRSTPPVSVPGIVFLRPPPPARVSPAVILSIAHRFPYDKGFSDLSTPLVLKIYIITSKILRPRQMRFLCLLAGLDSVVDTSAEPGT